MNKSLQKVVNKVMGRIAPRKGYSPDKQIAKQALIKQQIAKPKSYKQVKSSKI